MSSLRPSDWQAAQHFDERFIRKQGGSFLSQPKQTIWVSRNRTLRTQYLDSGVFLRKQYKILASYKDFCKLQFLFMYSFIHINVVFLFKPLPSKNSSWWRRLEDVLKASFVFVFGRRLDQDEYVRLSLTSSEDVFKTSSRRLDQDEYVRLSLTSSEDVFKTSSRRLGQDQYICLGYTSSRRLQDVFKTSSRRLAKTSSRHLQDVFKTFWRRLQDIFKTSCKDIFKTFSRRIIKLNCSC